MLQLSTKNAMKGNILKQVICFYQKDYNDHTDSTLMLSRFPDLHYHVVILHTVIHRIEAQIHFGNKLKE